MELDDMKLAWQAVEQRLDTQMAFSQRLWREHRLDKLRHGLRPLRWGQAAQIVFGFFMMLWGASFWATHLHVMHAFWCGVVVQAFGMAMIVLAIRLLLLAQAIDFAAPVLDIQRRLASMRVWRVKVEAPLMVLMGSFIWIPIILMLIQRDWDRLGYDYWDRLPGLVPWLALNGLVALVLVLLVYWLMKKAGRARWLENNFAGSAIRRAQAELDEIIRFERE